MEIVFHGGETEIFVRWLQRSCSIEEYFNGMVVQLIEGQFEFIQLLSVEQMARLRAS